MKINIIEKDKQIILKNIKDFEPKHIFECGQAFRWYAEADGSYTTIAYGKVLNVKKEDEDVILSNTNIDDFNNIWYHYFDFKRDYGKIKKELSKDPILKDAIGFGEGIRILNQEAFETLISFIISANNQIPRIRKSIEAISREYGSYIEEYEGKDYYSFPSVDQLLKARVEDLREKTKVGFRDKRIIDTSKMIKNKDVILEDIFEMTRDDGKKELMLLPGVGPKVSDCVLLFAFDKGDAFPVDVWVKRIMEHFYLKEEVKVKDIGEHGSRLFGDLAGFAQQYLFYYAREEEIGK